MAVALEGHVGGHVRLRDVFGKSFRLFGRHFVAFCSLAAIAISPFYLTSLAISPDPPSWAVATVFIMLFVCILSANGAVTYGVVQDLHGRSALMLDTVNALARHVLAIIGVAISVTLLVLMGLLLEMAVLARIGNSLPRSDAVYTSIILLPTAVVLCIFFVAAPVCVAERAGVGKSLARSWFLTKGYRWRIFGTFMLILVPDIAVSAAARAAGIWMHTYVGRLIAEHVVLIAASWVVETVFVAFFSVVTAVFYYELRAAKDGAKVAGVFD
jgi:hypothetical protein